MTRPHKDLDICYSQFNGTAVNSVPVIRMFGPTLVGQKVCLHLHKVHMRGFKNGLYLNNVQAFPYFFLTSNEDISLNSDQGTSFFKIFIIYLLFIIYYLLFIIYYLLFIIYYLLFIIYYLLFIIYINNL
jgi:hypothetical protein